MIIIIIILIVYCWRLFLVGCLQFWLNHDKRISKQLKGQSVQRTSSSNSNHSCHTQWWSGVWWPIQKLRKRRKRRWRVWVRMGKLRVIGACPSEAESRCKLLVMQVWNVLHAASWKYRTQKIAKKSPSGHHRTTLSGYVFATKAPVDNRKKNFLNNNTSSTMMIIRWTSAH